MTEGSSMTRVEALMALLLVDGMHGASQAEKCARLNLAGFTNTEVAALLDTTPAVVSQNLYAIKKAAKKAPAKKAPAK